MAFVLINPRPHGIGDRITIRFRDDPINRVSGKTYYRPWLRIAIGNNIANKFKFEVGKRVNVSYDDETNRIMLALGDSGYCLSSNGKYSIKLCIPFLNKVDINNDAYYEENEGAIIIHLDNKVLCG
jgi:hypothetical protein